MVVEQGGTEVVGGSDGVEVTREVQVDVLHGDKLGMSPARRPALDAEDGAKRRLT